MAPAYFGHTPQCNHSDSHKVMCMMHMYVKSSTSNKPHKETDKKVLFSEVNSSPFQTKILRLQIEILL